jgi:hypothetical protein
MGTTEPLRGRKMGLGFDTTFGFLKTGFEYPFLKVGRAYIYRARVE